MTAAARRVSGLVLGVATALGAPCAAMAAGEVAASPPLRATAVAPEAPVDRVAPPIGPTASNEAAAAIAVGMPLRASSIPSLVSPPATSPSPPAGNGLGTATTAPLPPAGALSPIRSATGSETGK